MICHTLQLVEAAREEDREKPYYTVRELARRIEPPIGDAEHVIVKVFQDMRTSIESYMAVFKIYTRRLYGFSLELDCPPPKIVRDKIYPGFWVGVYEHTHHETCVRVIVHPHLKNYHRMVEEVEAQLVNVAGLQPLVNSLILSAPTLSLINHIQRIALELAWLVEREPKRYTLLEPSEEGTILKLETTAQPIPRLYKVAYQPNRQLLATIAITAQALAQAIHAIEDLAGKSREEAKAQRYATSLWHIAKRSLDKLKQMLATLLENPTVQEALSNPQHLDPGKYAYLAQATKILSQGLAAPLGQVKTRQLLYPSTKLYELYVYATLAKQFKNKGYKVEPLSSPLQLRISKDSTKIRTYYNHYPPKLSRLIAPLTGKTPKPDILAHQTKPKQARIIIEAKYRHLDTTRPKMLQLADAIRVAAYLLDVAKDGKLTTIITLLAKPPKHELEQITAKIKPLNDKQLNIQILEINPDTKQEDIAETIQTLTQT